MLKLTSKSGIARGKQEVVYNYVSDFRNFANLLPADKLEDIEIKERSMLFTLAGLGKVGLKIAAQHPFSQLVVDAIEGTAADFTFRINIAEDKPHTSVVNIELEANLNMFIEMMAKGPLQKFLDLMIDKMEDLKFEV